MKTVVICLTILFIVSEFIDNNKINQKLNKSEIEIISLKKAIYKCAIDTSHKWWIKMK